MKNKPHRSLQIKQLAAEPTLFFCEWDCPDSGEIHTIESLVRDYYRANAFDETSEPWRCYPVHEAEEPRGDDWGECSTLLNVLGALMSDDPQSDSVLHHWREAHRRFYFVSENMTVMIATPEHLADKTNTRRDLGKS